MRIARLVLLAFAAAVLLPERQVAAGPRPPADLRAAVQLQKEQRQGKWFVRMRFTVHNAGGTQAPQHVLGVWCRANAGGPCPAVIPKPEYRVGAVVVPGATPAVHLTTPTIAPGASVFVFGPDTQEWRAGNYTITARADLTEHVPESNEANNEASGNVNIP